MDWVLSMFFSKILNFSLIWVLRVIYQFLVPYPPEWYIIDQVIIAYDVWEEEYHQCWKKLMIPPMYEVIAMLAIDSIVRTSLPSFGDVANLHQ